MDLIDKILGEGRTRLSEYESKLVLAAYGIPVTKEILVSDRSSLVPALHELGYPLVLKACSPDISHKTDQKLIHVDIRSEAEAQAAFDELLTKMNPGPGAVLVQEMVAGQREVMAGLTRDPQFGPCVMFGLGGIFTEILKDVSFRLAPLQMRDAHEMMQEIRGHKILDAVRGMEPVNTETLAQILISIGRIGLENERVKEIDVNPLIIRQGEPVAVDALVILD
jgi:acetate---CoA ligase (ADP-forming) subunit beta